MKFVREVNSEENTTFYIASDDHVATLAILQKIAQTNKVRPKLYSAMFMDRGKTNKVLEVVHLTIINDKVGVFTDKLEELADGDYTRQEHVEVKRETRFEEDAGSDWLNNALGRKKPQASDSEEPAEKGAGGKWLDHVLGKNQDD